MSQKNKKHKKKNNPMEAEDSLPEALPAAPVSDPVPETDAENEPDPVSVTQTLSFETEEAPEETILPPKEAEKGEDTFLPPAGFGFSLRARMKPVAPDSLPTLDTPDAPHFHGGQSLTGRNIDLLVALTPLLMWAVFVYGWRALTLTALSVASCVLSGWLTRFLLRRPDPTQTLRDGSDIVLGILLACLLPVTVPLWIPVAGGVFATVVVRELFGGGRTLFPPAVATGVLLNLCFPRWVGADPLPFVHPAPFAPAPAAELAESPLLLLRRGAFSSYSPVDLFVGSCPGKLGEISVLLIAGGALYLILRRVLKPEAPLTFLLTVALLTFFFPQTTLSSDAMSLKFMLHELLTGGLVFGAVYLTDGPLLPAGRIVYGVGCGLLTVLFRYFGSAGEGVLPAILFMNLFIGLIDRLTLPRRFGGKARQNRLTLRSLWESTVTDRLAFCDPPVWMRGIPLTVLAALLALLSLSGFLSLIF